MHCQKYAKNKKRKGVTGVIGVNQQLRSLLSAMFIHYDACCWFSTNVRSGFTWLWGELNATLLQWVKLGLSQDGGTCVIFTLTVPCFRFTLMILNSILARIKHVLHYKDQWVKSENDTQVVIHWEKCVCLFVVAGGKSSYRCVLCILLQFSCCTVVNSGRVICILSVSECGF